MAKLVILSESLKGRSHELSVDKTTVGRVEDNTFPIAESSVSSHHCEILLRGSDVLVRDLNSTNGTFINGEKITEAVLKPGQSLRLGHVEMWLDNGSTPAPQPSPSPAPAPAPAPASSSKKPAMDATLVIPRGVSLSELEQGSKGGFDTTGKGFTKKQNKTNKIFLIVGIVIGVVILVVLAIAFMSAGKPPPVR
ncbi:MAG: FHA domain-containing protein [Verrucomicrobia bacterium]|nr:MAG: FHA domain-containing protein [Verrucomicrobiota bacterium]